MRTIALSLIVFLVSGLTFAKQFEKDKINPDDFQEMKVKVGGDFAIQMQSIEHSADSALFDLKKNINLPTASLKLTADLAPGIQMYLNTYLSSRHHNEAWVEGGYLTIDQLPFLESADRVMEYVTIKAGVMMPNYGDAHFYRSTNADVSENPFVGNWIMDAYTTNPGIEVMFRSEGIFAMVGANNGRVNYGRGNDIGDDLVFNWKLAYDKDINDDLSARVSLSGFHVGEGHSGAYLWDGDRAGARYYNVMQMASAESDNFRSGRWSPGSGQSEMDSYMANLFVQFKDLEVFGIYETMDGVKKGSDQEFTQVAVQAIYNIGAFYFGGRYNMVEDGGDSEVTRINIGGGWDMTDNVVIKLDYVNQEYKGSAHSFGEGEFDGIVVEAAISF